MRGRPLLRIGDVGYVRFGGFHRLFNVHLPHGHLLQSTQLPEYFEHLPFDPEHVYSRTLSEGGYYSRSVRAVKVSGQISSG